MKDLKDKNCLFQKVAVISGIFLTMAFTTAKADDLVCQDPERRLSRNYTEIIKLVENERGLHDVIYATTRENAMPIIIMENLDCIEAPPELDPRVRTCISQEQSFSYFSVRRVDEQFVMSPRASIPGEKRTYSYLKVELISPLITVISDLPKEFVFEIGKCALN